MSGQPHDALFKAAFSQPENAAALVRCNLPPSLDAYFDWPTIRLVSGSFVDAALAQRFSDLLFEVDSTLGSALIYLLFEHQSLNYLRMPLRMSGYMGGTWERIDKQQPRGFLPPIIPVLISNAPEGWTSPRTFHELFDPTLFERAPELARFVPNFELLVDDLRRSSDDDLASRGLAEFAKLALWLLRDGRGGRLLDAVKRWVGLLDELPPGPFEAALRYIVSITASNPVIWEEFRANLHQQAEGKVMTLIDQWISQGEAKGLEKGRVEGRVEGRMEGRVESLTKQLTLKFGELSEPARSRLTGASPSEIEVWLERVLFATTLEQVLGERH